MNPIQAEIDQIKHMASQSCQSIIDSAKSDYLNKLEQAFVTGTTNSIQSLPISEQVKTDSLAYVQTMFDQGEFRPNITFLGPFMEDNLTPLCSWMK